MKRKIASLTLCLVLVMSVVCQSAICAYAATNPFTKTGNMTQDMVNAALAQQNKKVADFSGMPKDNWCAYFICWCANASGAAASGALPTKYSDSSTTGKVAYWVAKHKGMVYVFTADGRSKMQQNAPNGNWSYVSRSSVTPKVGDIALFHWKGASGTWNHVGIVYKVDSSKIYYVDGNGVSGGYLNSYVTTHSLSRTSSEIAGYIRPAYSDSGGTVSGGPVSSSITLKSASYKNLKENSVQLRGTCQYSGTRPSEVGLYLGTSSNNMSKVDSDKINHTKNPFDIWYDRSGLKPGTTYYWRLYAVVNGTTVWNSDGVQSFRTPGTAPVTNYTLNFQTNGGSSISSVKKAAGTSVSLSGYIPSRSGYTFAGWYSDSSLTNRVTSVTLNANMTVYAGWTKDEQQQDDDEVYVRGFTDVTKNSPYAAAVRYVFDNQLMNGVSSTQFKPAGSLSRAMIVTILYRQEGSPSVYGSTGFRDVSSGQWYSDGVAWAAKNGIVNGYGNGTFGPNDNVSREQMVTILYRYAQRKGIDTSGSGSLSRYPDAGNISSYAEIPYRWAIAEGVIDPLTSNLYPALYAFRGEAAVAFKALNEI